MVRLRLLGEDRIKWIAEIVLVPVALLTCQLLLTEPLKRLTDPADKATVTTYDTGVRLSVAKLRGIADQMVPPPSMTSAVAANATDAPTMLDNFEGRLSAAPSVGPTPTPSPSPPVAPETIDDRLAIYLADVRNDGSTVIADKRFDLKLMPEVAGQAPGTLYRAGNAPDAQIYDRRNQGVHIWPNFKSAWIGVPRLEPGGHLSAWIIGDADRTLQATPRAGAHGLAVRPAPATRDRLFGPQGGLWPALRANAGALAISFMIAVCLVVGGLRWAANRRGRPAQPPAPA